MKDQLREIMAQPPLQCVLSVTQQNSNNLESQEYHQKHMLKQGFITVVADTATFTNQHRVVEGNAKHYRLNLQAGRFNTKYVQEKHTSKNTLSAVFLVAKHTVHVCVDGKLSGHTHV